jgi:hypothetical protein
VANPSLPTSTTPSSAATQGDVDARLQKPKALFDKGLITQEDYDRRRAEIVRSL